MSSCSVCSQVAPLKDNKCSTCNIKKEIKKSNENNDNYDEYGFCKDCHWNSCYEESHIHYGNKGCKYITSKYKISLNEDGEIEYEEL